MGVLAWGDAVDIGGGRGRLAPAPAASLARVDAAFRSAFGRAADINEAWRSPADADENYRKYIAWLNGAGPWAPIALPGDKSVHCFGFAVDTDDTTDAQMRIWNEHGWYWTVYRNGQLAERWHLEYFPDRDKHRNDPAPGRPAAVTSEEDEMLALKIDAGPRGVHLCTLGNGVFRHLIEDDNPERVKNIIRGDDAWTEIGIHELNTYLWTYGCRTDIHLIAEKDGRFEFQVKTPDEGGIFRSGGMWHR
ncbi:hypothetical protein AB1K56_07935 [Microbacterium sp. BWR-S6Y]|uniref:hypothetical protein n=1 Tax=Microbacterium sp. BWR-S6Y TaxID=3232073 RepID=UPI003528E61A